MIVAMGKTMNDGIDVHVTMTIGLMGLDVWGTRSYE